MGLRIPFQQKIGAGLTIEHFDEKVKAGLLRHVGLTESMQLIAAGVGWRLDRTDDNVDPVIACDKVTTPDLTIEPGMALGVNQIGRGFVGGEEVITLVFRAAVGEPNPRDRILIQGSPTVDTTIDKGINGDIATCAIVVNAIPTVVGAAPGLRTMADIGLISCVA